MSTRKFKSQEDKRVHDRVSSVLENEGSRHSLPAAFVAVVDFGRWSGMTDPEIQEAVVRALDLLKNLKP